MARHDVGYSPRRLRKCADSDEQDASGGDLDRVRTALRLWQPRASRALSQEDARVIAENLVGFFRVLAEWDANERSSEAADDNNVTSEFPPRKAHGPQ